MAKRIDFEGEGLLDGLSDEERESRLALLRRLEEDGASLEELRAAVAEGRLAVLPVEHLLGGEPRYSLEEVAERSGVPAEVLSRQLRSLGAAVPETGVVAFSGDDLEQAHRAKLLLDSGLSEDELAELGRTIAVAMSQFAAASRQVMATAFAAPGDTELELADRLDKQAEDLIPLVGPALDYTYRLHLREQLRHAAVDASDLRDRSAPASETVTVGFADIVGYTELGQSVLPEELGRVTGRLDELAREVASGPVRLVKLIGDAAMLASPDTEALIEAMLELLGAIGDESEGPAAVLRAGIARGSVISRGGDYYGTPVNLASRITDAARPDSILVSREVKAEVETLYDFSDAGRKHLKGIGEPVHVWRCREPEHDEDDDEQDDGRPHSGRRRSRGRKARRRR